VAQFRKTFTTKTRRHTKEKRCALTGKATLHTSFWHSVKSCEKVFLDSAFPQRWKPLLIRGSYGTSELVPFPNLRESSFSANCQCCFVGSRSVRAVESVSTGNRYNDDNILEARTFVVALLAAMSNNAPELKRPECCLLVVRRRHGFGKAARDWIVDSAADKCRDEALLLSVNLGEALMFMEMRRRGSVPPAWFGCLLVLLGLLSAATRSSAGSSIKGPSPTPRRCFAEGECGPEDREGHTRSALQ